MIKRLTIFTEKSDTEGRVNWDDDIFLREVDDVDVEVGISFPGLRPMRSSAWARNLGKVQEPMSCR